MKLFSTLFMTFCSLVLLAGCSPLIVVDALSPEDGYRVESGLSFGPEARQALDVYRPLQARPGAPVVVFFYGGSWRRGERGNYRFVGQSLAARGYTVAIPDYRLYPEVAFPTFVEDGARAVAWVARSLPEAKNGIMLIGHSAGAHIAALLTLDRSYLAAWDLSADDLAGMIGLAGPYAFDPSRSPRFKPIFAAAQPPDSSQPLKHARGDAPPLLGIRHDHDVARLEVALGRRGKGDGRDHLQEREARGLGLEAAMRAARRELFEERGVADGFGRGVGRRPEAERKGLFECGHDLVLQAGAYGGRGWADYAAGPAWSSRWRIERRSRQAWRLWAGLLSR